VAKPSVTTGVSVRNGENTSRVLLRAL